MRESCSASQARDRSTGEECRNTEKPQSCSSSGGGGGFGSGDLLIGNPIHAGTGVKIEALQVYRGVPGYSLYYLWGGQAYYAYRPNSSQGMSWSSTYDRRLSPQYDAVPPVGPSYVSLSRDGGVLLRLDRQGTSDTYLPSADLHLRLTRLINASGETTGWRLVTEGGVENYDAAGKLLNLFDTAGNIQTFGYDASGRIGTVSDGNGRTLSFVYDANNRVSKLTQPDGGEVQFTYDAKGNLSTVTWPDGKTKTYHYEDSRYANGLTGITDENGVRYATWVYDGQGRAISSEHAGGVDKYTLTYNAGNTVVTDPLGTKRTKNLTTILGVVKSTGSNQPGGSGCGPAASNLSYDANGNVSSRTDFNGNVTKYSYDLTKNLETQRIEAFGKAEQRTISTVWHSYWRLPTQEAEPQKKTTYIYNGDGGQYCAPQSATVPSINGGTQPIGVLCSRSEQATTDVNGSAGLSAAVTGTPRIWKWTYNQYGQVLTADGPRTDVTDLTTYTYYAADDPDLGKRGNIATVTNALGHVTQISAYDLNGRPLTLIDPNGRVTQLTYDLRGRLTGQSVGTEATSYQYDGVGQLTKVTLPDGSYIAYTYDPAHRLTQIADALGNTVTYTLDAMGNRLKEDIKDPGGQLSRTRQRAYDALARLAQDIGAQGQTTRYEYDANGNRTKVTDPLNQVTVSGYDALNRLIQITDPGQGQTKYGYDGQDRLVQVTDPRNLVTRYTVDGLGNRSQLQSPDTGTTVSAYDAAGNEISRTDAKGQSTATQYDALNRPIRITHADGSRIDYTWDQGANGLGRLSRIDEVQNNIVTGSLTYTYDGQGRIASETRTIGTLSHTQSSTWVGGQLMSFTTPGGRTLTYTRNAAGRISQVVLTDQGQNKTLAQNIEYHPFGGIKRYTDGAGQIHQRNQDQDGRTSGYTLGTQTWLLTFDAASRITGQMDGGNANNSATYGYDALDRLTSAVLPNTHYGYGYDPTGNRTSQTSGSTTRTYSTDAGSNRLTGLTNPSQSYQYDANGSVTHDGVNQYGYDARGRLTQATTAAGTVSYRINALGQRVKKQNTQVETYYHYDQGGRLIAESDGNGQIKKEYIWLEDTPIAVLQ